jgi:hypothetical protein
MIAKQDLLNYGFIESGSSGNREYFKLGKFEVCQHLGETFHVQPNGVNPYSKDFDTIEELDAYYKQWATKKLQKLVKQEKGILKEIEHLVFQLTL